jgi:hypothetical protein
VIGTGYDSNGNLESSIAGAAGSNDWGAWTQTFPGTALNTLNGNSSAANNSSWAWNFTKSFFGGFRIDTTPGSCLGVALDSSKPLLNAFKKTRDYAKDYAAPVVASLPGMGAGISNTIYSTVQYGADRGNALEMAGAVSAATAFLYTQGRAAVTAVASAARNPYVLLGTFDAALAYGVGNEAVAAYQGKCH